jgi:ABC-2 type transport system permease protein
MRRASVLTLAGAFLRKDATEEFSYPLALLLTELGLFVPMIAYLFVGDLVGSSDVIGGDYFTYAAIGISVTVMLGSALMGFGYALQQSQTRGQFETLLVEPVPWLFLPVTMNAWKTVLGTVNGILVLTVAGILGANFIMGGLPQLAILILLGITAETGIGILAASLMVVAKRAQPVLTLYGLAASLLGGALFSVDQLPSWIRWASYLVPRTYVINASRTLLMEDPGTFVISFQTAVVVLSIFTIIVLPLGLWLLWRSMQYARREGILAGY